MSATDWFVIGCFVVTSAIEAVRWRRSRREHREAMARIEALK